MFVIKVNWDIHLYFSVANGIWNQEGNYVTYRPTTETWSPSAYRQMVIPL